MAGSATLTFESVAMHGSAVHFCLRDQESSRNCLVRVHRRVLDTNAAAEHFAQEVGRARQAAVHSRVAKLLAAGLTADRRPYLVQDIGPAALLPSAALGVTEVIDIGAKLADALTVAHNRGTTYGPIDPSHVLLAPDGEPMLTFPSLPMFASAQVPPSTPGRDVSALCATLLALLDDQLSEGARGRGNPPAAAPGS
ncbi:hypothetical protein ACWGNM_24210 [Streptomyces sp. NPDC055796]